MRTWHRFLFPRRRPRSIYPDDPAPGTASPAPFPGWPPPVDLLAPDTRVVVPAVVLPALEAWLETNEMRLVILEDGADPDQPTYTIMAAKSAFRPRPRRT